ncbi:MAG TPA: hypothetical protein EYN67_14810 [Flavobacteriales bacterium]|nr:hypothetical protein [Flavobacteriales bacterium]
MTFNGVEQGCIRSQAVVYLLDVYQDGLCLDEPFTTAHLYRRALIVKARNLTGKINRKSRKYLLSVVNKSYTTAEQYTKAIGYEMDRIRSEVNAK